MREHETEGRKCWCNPHVRVLCEECDGSPEGCWRCERGTLPCESPDTYDAPHRLIIVHTATPTRPEEGAER